MKCKGVNGISWNTIFGEGAMLSTSINMQLVRLAGPLKLHVYENLCQYKCPNLEQPKSSSNIVKNFL